MEEQKKYSKNILDENLEILESESNSNIDEYAENVGDVANINESEPLNLQKYLNQNRQNRYKNAKLGSNNTSQINNEKNNNRRFERAKRNINNKETINSMNMLDNKNSLNKSNNNLKKNSEKVLNNNSNKLKKPLKSVNKTKDAKEIVNKAKKIKWLKNPIVWYVMFFIFIIIFFFFIIAAITGSEGNEYGSGGSYYNNSRCEYVVDGVATGDLVVELLNCDGTDSGIMVPFEKYILGVALAEIGESSPDEAIKAQIIMARNFALKRNSQMCPGSKECAYGLQKDGNSIKMRMCENDQVYWDYTKDIYILKKGEVNQYSPEIDSETEGATLWKSALSDERIKILENLAQDVMGEYIVDSANKMLEISYTKTESDKVIALANQGNDYVQILKTVYSNAYNVLSVKCSTASEYTPINGEYSLWKQKDSRWANQYIGSGTIGEIGCAATSLAIVLARSGVEHKINNLNPGTFVTEYKKLGGFSGNIIKWDFIHKATVKSDLHLIHSTKYPSITDDGKKAKIKELIEDSCLVVMQVKSGGDNDTHFVVIDDLTTKSSNYSKVYMWDPATKSTDLFATYGRSKAWGERFLCFKVG